MRLNTDQIILRRGKLTIRMADSTGRAGGVHGGIERRGGRSVFRRPGRIFVNRGRAGSGRVVPSVTAVRGSSAGADVSPTASLMWCDQGLVYVDAAGEQICSIGYETPLRRARRPADAHERRMPSTRS